MEPDSRALSTRITTARLIDPEPDDLLWQAHRRVLLDHGLQVAAAVVVNLHQVSDDDHVIHVLLPDGRLATWEIFLPPDGGMPRRRHYECRDITAEDETLLGRALEAAYLVQSERGHGRAPSQTE